MDEGAAEKLRQQIAPHINKESGNMIFVVGSSECGKSTITCEVLLPILSKDNGFITSFMSPNYDSIPLQKLILKHKKDDSKDVTWDPAELKRGYKSKKEKKVQKKGDIDKELFKGEKGISSNTGNSSGISGLPQFKISDLYKTDQWIFLKRGWDPSYAWKMYHLRLLLNKRYNDSGEVRNFRLCMVLDDEIDLKPGLLRQICLTWRNRNITFVQNCQDITNLDVACRNSVQLFFFGYSNFPARREKLVREYCAPFLTGANVQEKMDTFYHLTLDKCFIFVDNRKRTAYHVNTKTGEMNELRELGTESDHAMGNAAAAEGTRDVNKHPVGLEAPPPAAVGGVNNRKRKQELLQQPGEDSIEKRKKRKKKKAPNSLYEIPTKI